VTKFRSGPVKASPASDVTKLRRAGAELAVFHPGAADRQAR
jgi:hypothetical protein